MVGPQVERLYGRARFVILYVLTGVGGVVGSYLYHPEYKSAGASGAIFGLFGVLLVFGIRYRQSIPPEFKRAVGTGVLPIIVINLIIGFTIPAIDNSAHIGGLIAGALLAALVPFEKPREETSPGFKFLQTTLLALIAVSFFFVAKNYDGPHLSVRNIGRNMSLLPTAGSAADEFVDALNDSRKTFELSVDILGSGRTDQLTYLKRDLGKSMDRLRKIPSLDAKTDELSSSLARVLQEQYELAENIERSGTVTFGHNLQLKENVRAYRDVMMEISEWIQKNGSRFGIQMRQGTAD
jgi:rhomboid protease GluP